MQRWGYKSDDSELIDLARWLRETYGMHRFDIWRDYFLLIDPAEESTYRIKHTLSQGDVEKYIVHRPDIILTPGNRKIIIIEIDGSIHHWKHIKKKTAKRNGHYTDYKIPHIIIDKMELDGMPVEEAIRIGLEKHGMTPVLA